MAKILTVDIPNAVIRELEREAKRETRRTGKEVTAEQLIGRAVRLYIRHMKKKYREEPR